MRQTVENDSSMEEWITEDVEAKRRKNILFSILFLLAAAAILALWWIGTMAMERRGLTWLYPWMEAMMPGAAALLLLWMAILWIPMKNSGKTVLGILGAAILVLVLGIFHMQSEENILVSKSPGREHVLVIREDEAAGTATVCRTFYKLWKRDKEQLGFTVAGDFKTQWLQEDICAATYESSDGSIHQYIAAYGDRGDGISYQDPMSAVMGDWAAADTSDVGWKLTIEGGTVVLENDSSVWYFEDKDCVRYGTIAVVLCDEEAPVWTLALNEDCQINYDGLTAKGGTLTLCSVAMDKTEALTFTCTSSRNEYARQNPELVEWAQEQEENKDEKILQMYEYAEQGMKSSEKPGYGMGIYQVPVNDEEEAWNVRTALLLSEEAYRVNGVDVRCQIDSVTRLAGDSSDGLYEVVFTELCITPGNQGAGPEGESIQLTWNIRMMKASDGYYAYIPGGREDGMYGLEDTPDETFELGDLQEYSYFLSGTYDTAYMYVSRRNPQEGMEAVYQEYLKNQYPKGELSEYDGMPCMDLTGDGTLWLTYYGISEDYTSYDYRIVETGESGLSQTGRFTVAEMYSTPIRPEN